MACEEAPAPWVMLSPTHATLIFAAAGGVIDIPAGAIDPGFGPVGVGASKFTLSDQAATDVHLYSLMDFYINKNHQLIGTYQPDGRDYAPASTYDTTPRTTSLAVFNSKDPNGDWVLNIYD